MLLNLYFAVALSAATANPKALALNIKKDLAKKQRMDSYMPSKRDNEITAPLTNRNGWYSVELKYGSQQSSYDVDIDTGSADLYVAKRFFDPSGSSTFNNLTTDFSICYPDWCIAGYYGKDQIQVGGTTVNNAQFAVVNNDDATSLIGLGYKYMESCNEWDMDTHTSKNTYDNFPYAVKNAGLIEKASYSIWLNGQSQPTGQLIFGGVDTAKYEGTLQTLPSITHPFNTNGQTFTPQDPTDISIILNGFSLKDSSGTTTDIITNGAMPCLIDSGASISRLPKSWLSALGSAFGAEWDDTVQAVVSPTIVTDVDLILNFQGVEITIPMNDLWGEATHDGQNYQKDGKQMYYIKFVVGTDDVDLQDVNLLGDPFLQYVYFVANLDDRIIALAQAKTGDISDSNVVAIDSNGIPSATQAPSYSSSSIFTTYSVTTPSSVVGNPTTPSW